MDLCKELLCVCMHMDIYAYVYMVIFVYIDCVSYYHTNKYKTIFEKRHSNATSFFLINLLKCALFCSV